MTSTARRKSKVKSQKSKVKRIVFRAFAPFEMVCLFPPCCTRSLYQVVAFGGEGTGSEVVDASLKIL